MAIASRAAAAANSPLLALRAARARTHTLRPTPTLAPTLTPTPTLARGITDFVKGTTPDGLKYKLPLDNPKVVGVWTARGERAYQEDATNVCAMEMHKDEIKASLPPKVEWNGNGDEGRQVEFFGIFDGHGGKQVSSFLKERLAGLIETVQPSDIVPVLRSTFELGGYFRRWRGGVLRRWSPNWSLTGEIPPEGERMTLEERLTLAFLKTIRTEIPEAEHCGSTASVVLVHSLDDPAQPHFSTQRLHLTVAHAGDTRVLLCNTKLGEVTALTDYHHAESRIEADRLRRMGTDRLITDSFGESRWMGAIENTRGFGDTQWKASGVTAEPEVSTRVIDGGEHAYLIMVTDGLTSMLSDQELVDLARRSADPGRAAKTIVHFGEDLGSRDNCTCIVIPLAGWGKVGGEDSTLARREYRRVQADKYNTRMQRM